MERPKGVHPAKLMWDDRYADWRDSRRGAAKYTPFLQRDGAEPPQILAQVAQVKRQQSLTGTSDGEKRPEDDRGKHLEHVASHAGRIVTIFIWVETAGRPREFDLRAVEAKLRADVASKIIPSAGNSLIITMGDRTGRPADLGWKYDIPGGSYNYGGLDYVPIVNLFTKAYRAAHKKKTQYDGYVYFDEIEGYGYAYTNNAVTLISRTKTITTFDGAPCEDKSWVQYFSNALAHEQLHLGAFGGHDWLTAPEGHIASGTAWMNIPFTVDYGGWVSKFLGDLDLG